MKTLGIVKRHHPVGEEDGDRRSLLFGDWSRVPYGVHFAILSKDRIV